MIAKSPEDLPDHIIIDRCIVDGWPGNTTRGLYLDGRDVAVLGCQIMNITAAGESDGILITDTPGPILIENNAIGASGINIFIDPDDTVSRVLSYDNDVQNIAVTMGNGTPIQILVEPGGKIVEDIAFINDTLRGCPSS